MLEGQSMFDASEGFHTPPGVVLIAEVRSGS
jgi:hypothetical protein